MADATTTLNPGTGGDSMDESLVTQPSGPSAKRPRVVIGGDSGTSTNQTNDLVQPVSADPGANPNSSPVLPTGLVNDTPPDDYIAGELRPLSLTSEGRLRVAVAPAEISINFFGDDGPGDTDPYEFNMSAPSSFFFGE